MVVLVAVVFLAGMAASTLLLGHDRAPAAPGIPAPSSPEPSSESGSDEARPAPRADEAGAVDAALALAGASQSWLYLADDELEGAVRAVAAEASADTLVDDTLAEVGLVRDALSQSTGRIWWLVRPLAWRVDSFDPRRAVVSVWTVSTLSASGVAMPQADWMTVTFDLTWERGDWRLIGTHEVPGPTPQLGGRDTAWDPVPFDDALAGFRRVGAEVE